MRKITLRCNPFSGKKLESISINSFAKQAFSSCLGNDFFVRLFPKLAYARGASYLALLLDTSHSFVNQITLTNFNSGIGAIQCNIKNNREII